MKTQKKKPNYWAVEQKKQLDSLWLKKTNFMEQQLARDYSRVAKDVVSAVEDLYLEMLEDGDISYPRLMRFDRYYKLNASINQELKRLGVRQIEMLDQGMLDLYIRTGEMITGSESWGLVNKVLAEETVKRVWCADGKTYSDRVWADKNKLQQELQQGMMDCVIAGKDHRKLARTLQERFDVSKSSAERLVRTELNYVQNQAAARGYLDAGYTHYQFISAIDNRTCDECEDLDGQVFAFVDAKEGVNFPPMHSNCRSNIIGYKE